MDRIGARLLGDVPEGGGRPASPRTFCLDVSSPKLEGGAVRNEPRAADLFANGEGIPMALLERLVVAVERLADVAGRNFGAEVGLTPDPLLVALGAGLDEAKLRRDYEAAPDYSQRRVMPIDDSGRAAVTSPAVSHSGPGARAPIPEQAGPGQAEPAGVAIAPADVSRLSWRTPERAALLARDWPAGVLMAEIRAGLAALPGLALPNNGTIATWANDMGLRRPAGFRRAMRPGFAPRPERPEGPAKGARFTAERRALIAELWGASPPVVAREIAERCNALPGGTLRADEIRNYARGAGLPLRPHLQGARGQSAAGTWAGRPAKIKTARATPPAVAAPPRVSPPAVAGGGSAGVAPAVVPSPPPPAPVLPPPGPDGKVAASFAAIRHWAASWGLEYDGTNMADINLRRRLMHLPPLVQVGP